MSRGTTIIPVRLSAELIALIDGELAKRLEHPLVEPWTRSDFIRAAIREFTRKKRAGRSKGSKGG